MGVALVYLATFHTGSTEDKILTLNCNDYQLHKYLCWLGVTLYWYHFLRWLTVHVFVTKAVVEEVEFQVSRSFIDGTDQDSVCKHEGKTLFRGCVHDVWEGIKTKDTYFG